MAQKDLPLFDRPGRLDPGRKVPNTKDPSFTIHTHYREGDNVPADDRTVFTEESANAMQPFEDEALLRGDVKPRKTGKVTGNSYITKYYDPDSDYTEGGHKVKVNSDPMAGAASPVHAKSAFKAENPGFFNDIRKLGFYTAAVCLLIALEIGCLIWLFL